MTCSSETIDTKTLSNSIEYWNSVAPMDAEFYVDFTSHGAFYKDTFMRYAVWSEGCWQQTGYEYMPQFTSYVVISKPTGESL